MSRRRIGLYLYQSGVTNQFEYDETDFSYIDMLSGSYTDCMNFHWLGDCGWNVALICRDYNRECMLNKLATDIAGTNIHGDCLLTDFNKDLTQFDFYYILEQSIIHHERTRIKPFFKQLLDALTTRV